LEGEPVQRLSIIVPLTGNLKRFEDTLVSVLENQPEGSEVVVVLNQPYEDPYELRGEVEFVDAPHGAGLIECFACGLAASTAPVVHLIASGFEAMPGWADAALARFDDEAVAAVAPLLIDRDRPQRILSAGLRYTAAGSIGRIAAGKRLDRFAANDQVLSGPELTAAFFRRDALEIIESMPHHGSELVAATNLALELRSAGYRCVQEPGCLMTATAKVLGARSAWCEGVASERLFHRWTAVPGWRRSWLAHAVLVVLECLQFPFRPSNLGRLVGRLWATLGFGSGRPVAIGSQAAPRQGAVIRPPHFSAVEPRSALQSRAAG
jgi:hypothetical protein